MLAITPQPSVNIVTPTRPTVDQSLWLNYFDPQAAVKSVIYHVESLPGSRHERHTMRAYLTSLADYCDNLGAVVIRKDEETYIFHFDFMKMPTRANTSEYIASCKRRGLTSSTVTRYMAAVRHFLRALEEQEVYPQNGSDFVFIMQAQRQLKLAASVKNPAADTTSNRPALEQHGERLTLAQINRVFESFWAELDTLTGMRDLALLYLGITSGLRAAEIARITPNNITAGDDCYEIRVRGKRSNIDPVGIDATAYSLIMNFVNSWNTRAGDDRQITGNTPVFQPLLRGDHIPELGLRGFDPDRGLSSRAILQIVERRTKSALGKPITAHDMRRTCAYMMRQNGFEWDTIRAQLRHRSIGTTEKYVGQNQDLSKGLLSKRVHFNIPGTSERYTAPADA